MALTKQDEYAAKITAQLLEIFNIDCENHISMNDLGIGNNATEFIHALANVAPNLIYIKITGDQKNLLEFNHMANHLCFQYSKSVK